MKKFQFKLLLIAPSLILTSCGYGLKEIYNGIPYASGDFFQNYYTVWNDSINPYKDGNKISQKVDKYALDETKDKVFTSVNDANFDANDAHSDDYVYYYDIYKPEGEVAKKKPYGPAVRLSNYDDSFRYGVVGKLFDGQMFCNGYYANARVQVKPGEGNGFGVLFSKECNDATYMMMNFKCSAVTETRQDLGSGHSDLALTVSLIYKNETGYTYVPITYNVTNVPTNSGDAFNNAGRFNAYTCFGFSLDSFEYDRLIGFTFEYEKTSCDVSGGSEEIHHAVMLYEVSFPYTTWH